MKQTKNNIILIVLLVIFFMTFRFSDLVHTSVIDSTKLFFTSLVPSMLPMFIMIDLLLNYGLGRVIYKIFKTNSVLLLILSLLGGTPSNAKYIREFYLDGYISKDTANFLLTFAYSPNPLFILAVSPTLKIAVSILAYLYSTNILIYFLFKKRFKDLKSSSKEFKSVSFVECLSNSIYKSFKVLILILGIVITFGIVNTLLDVLSINSPLICSMIELTNALAIITKTGAPIPWMIFAVSFAGLSIHAQIKSILEDTDLSYRYFLYGRLIAIVPALIMILFN